MKILVVCQYYYPENFQVNDICTELAARGHSVTVLTGLPNYPLGIVPEEYKNGRRDETINGVQIIRCYERGRGKGAISLALNYFSFILSSMRMVSKLESDFDLIFVYQLSPVLMALPAIEYAKKHCKPLFLYCCDLWPESLKMYIKSESNLIYRFVKVLSRKIYRSCDLIATQSKSFIDYLVEVCNVESDRLIYLPAFADEAYLKENFASENDVTDFVFLGNLGIAQNLFAILDAVELIKNVPKFKLHLVGDGACCEDLKRTVKEKHLEDIVIFYGRRPVSEMPDFYKLADACLVSLKADNKTGWTLPSKVQGYMAAGKPIIGMIDGSAKQVIDEAQCGICVTADDIYGLAKAMKDFIDNPEKYKNCGQNSREYFKANFRKDVFMKKIQNEFEKLVG